MKPRIVAISSGLIPLLIVIILFWFFGSNIITLIISIPLLIFSFSSIKTGLLGSDTLLDNMTSWKPVTRKIEHEWKEINTGKTNRKDFNDLISRLTNEINTENKKLSKLVERYRNNTDALSKVPELTNPEIVVPQTCKRQLVVYLKSKNLGISDIDSFRNVLLSRFDNNQNNSPEVKASSFENLIKTPNFTISDLCKSIIKSEQSIDTSSQLAEQIDSLVDEYFDSLNIKNLIR